MMIENNNAEFLKSILARIAYYLLLAAVVIGFLHIIDTSKSANVVFEGQAEINSLLPENGVIDLNGKWEFYPDQLLGPEDFIRRKYNQNYLDVPRTWQGQYVDGGKFPTNMFGTYRVKVDIPKHTGQPLGLMVNVVRSSNNVFVNGKHLGHAGYPGRTEVTTIPDVRPATYFFTGKGENEVIIQVANFVNGNRGGIITPVSIGNADNIYNASVDIVVSDIVSFVVFFVVLAIFAGQYFNRNKEMELLWFSCFCLFSMMLFSTMNSRLILQLAPYLPYENLVKIAYVSANWSMFSALMYIRSALKIKLKWLIYLLTAVMIVLTVVLIFLPLWNVTAAFTQMLKWDAVLALLTAAFMVYGVLKRTDGYEYLAFGVVCFLELYLATMLSSMGMLSSNWFVAIISALFSVSQLLFITERHRLNMLARQQTAL